MAGKKVTGRTKQLSLKSTPQFHQRLKALATKEKCLMIEILEKAMKLYESQGIQREVTKGGVQPNVSLAVESSVSKKRSRNDGELEEQSVSSKKRKVSKKNNSMS